MHYRMRGSNPDLCPSDAAGTPAPPVVTSCLQTHCPIFGGGDNWPPVEDHCHKGTLMNAKTFPRWSVRRVKITVYAPECLKDPAV